MHKSGFKKNCTVKGGVVMCELTKAIRRTTMDFDIDFVRIKHGALSMRAKDVFDLYDLKGEVNQRTLRKVLRDLVLQNKKCPIREPLKILEAVGRTFRSKRFVRDMSA